MKRIVKDNDFLLSLSTTQKSNSGRSRMAKPVNKYYALYIKTDPERMAKLDDLYKTYVRSAPQGKVQEKFNWRVPILKEWLSAESEDVQAHVNAERYKEMGLAPDGRPLPDDDIASAATANQPTHNTAEGTTEALRLKKAIIQQQYVNR